jgi:hypothetical protein
MFRWLPDRLQGTASVCRQRRRSNRWLWKRSSASSVVALPVSLPPKFRVSIAETEHIPFYLRRSFRLLSSWVPEEFSRSYRRVVRGLPDLSLPCSRAR